jgi:tetratricopeptide (TPR) repeat protein
LAEGVEALDLAATALEAHISRGQLDPAAAYPIVYGLWRREALLLELVGRGAAALARLERVRAGWVARGDPRRAARTLNEMGYVHTRRTRFDTARELTEMALAQGRELGDDKVIADALHNLGNIASQTGALGESEALLRESIARYRAAGGGRWLAGALCDLGAVYLIRGDLDKAREKYTQGLAVAEAIGDKPSIGHVLMMLGGLELNAGDLAAAEAYSQRAVGALQEIGDALLLSVCLVNLGHVALARREPIARQLYRESALLSQQVDLASNVAEALIGLAAVAIDYAPEQAGRWLGAVDGWRESTQFVMAEPFVRALRQEAEGAARAALGDGFAAIRDEGQALALETAAAQALAWAATMEYQL